MGMRSEDVLMYREGASIQSLPAFEMGSDAIRLNGEPQIAMIRVF
jgi:hypothetical protein